MSFQKATRTKKKLRLALIGPSGSGKTKTALELAVGLCKTGRIALIDSEHKRASLYADQYDFDSDELDNFNPRTYIKDIQSAVAAGIYDVLIIDSGSHAWMGLGGVLDQVNQTKGNQFTDGWGKIGTPLQNEFIEAILTANLHIIMTIRQKVDYVIELNDRGKNVPRKVGLAPVQRADLEYEFDFVGWMDMTHTLTIQKSFDDNIPVGMEINRPTRDLSQKFLKWLDQGQASAATQIETPVTAEAKNQSEPADANGNTGASAPSQPAPTPATRAAQSTRSHPPLSPVQRNKLTELYRVLHPALTDDDQVAEGLDKLFTDSFKHGINDATYEEGARLTGQLLSDLRSATRDQQPTANAAQATTTAAPAPAANVSPDPLKLLRAWEAQYTAQYQTKPPTEEEDKRVSAQIVFALKATAIGDDVERRHALKVKLFGKQDINAAQRAAMLKWISTDAAKPYIRDLVINEMQTPTQPVPALSGMDFGKGPQIPSKAKITREEHTKIVHALAKTLNGDVDHAEQEADNLFKRHFRHPIASGTHEEYEKIIAGLAPANS